MEKRAIFILCMIGTLHTTRNLSCQDDELLCGDGFKCIKFSNLCDYSSDCNDSSDEFNLRLCKALTKYRDGCTNNHVACLDGYSCQNIQAACTSDACLGQSNDICEEIKHKKLSPVNYTKESISNKFKQKIEFLHSAMKSAWEKNFTNCPVLFKEYQGLCYSPFLPIQVNWEEAKLFCKAIAGQLVVIKDVIQFKEVLDFLHKNGIKQDLWIGGSSNNNTSKWRWEDGDQVPMGVPFWSLDYSLKISNRDLCHFGVNHVNINKGIRPREGDRFSKCLAMMKENFFYFSDESCGKTFSPLCTTKPLHPGVKFMKNKG